jgi:hypothetical protein
MLSLQNGTKNKTEGENINVDASDKRFLVNLLKRFFGEIFLDNIMKKITR